ncbi:metallophosphoesterase family protein [Limimaricola pyoseonensis]|uniref:Phosphoesterase n=1 Tax=Limimaricola pyoseonensis TaxID=521013 RepID=A0A1G7JDC3_9RHOB|nr:metallophosphoesterase family protein [Limimaricola pyoseonensis]SDF22930.1 hypothetical protein SAMN04488567_3680 [Limimaricola pyoseonensis]
MRVGVISDTHGLLRPEAIDALEGCDHILHAGDIGRDGLIGELEAIAPVTAIRGNVDTEGWAARFLETVETELAGTRIHMRHDLKTLGFDPGERNIAVVVSGHSHKPLIESRGGVLFLNPGAAGKRRFRLPVTLARLDLGPAGPRAELVHLID